jgi:hypothetical protein
MTQPSFVPIVEADQVRPAYRLGTPRQWRQGRPAELTSPAQPRGPEFGTPGPDQGYVLLLAEQLFASRVEVADGESPEDALTGTAAVAAARAALFGRAPVAKDLEHALTLFGYLGGAPDDLVAWRRPLFRGVSHHYRERRELVGRVPESTLRLTPEAVRQQSGDWRQLVDTV